MRVALHNGKKRTIIDPGEFYVTTEDEIISTLLGSCVAACLWDPVNRIIGMNHFLLASRHYPSSTPLVISDAGRYGVHAMELLINAMLRKGADKHRLQAKAFGGGNVLRAQLGGKQFFTIGDMNSRFIVEFLRNENIPLVSSHLGGNVGRIIHFTADDYSVYMKKMGTQAQGQLVSQEEAYLHKQLKDHDSQKQSTTPIQFW